MKTRMDRSEAEVLADDLFNDVVMALFDMDREDEIAVANTKKLLADFIEGLADAVEYDMLDEWMHRRAQEPIGQ